jgi:hypothetical protein
MRNKHTSTLEKIDATRKEKGASYVKNTPWHLDLRSERMIISKR